MSSFRMDRVNELIRSVLAEHISATIEFNPGAFVTITRVETSRDLAHAKVLVTAFPDQERDAMIVALQKNAHALRHVISQNTKLRRTPSLHFELDDTEAEAQHIEKILDSL